LVYDISRSLISYVNAVCVNNMTPLHSNDRRRSTQDVMRSPKYETMCENA